MKKTNDGVPQVVKNLFNEGTVLARKSAGLGIDCLVAFRLEEMIFTAEHHAKHGAVPMLVILKKARDFTKEEVESLGQTRLTAPR